MLVRGSAQRKTEAKVSKSKPKINEESSHRGEKVFNLYNHSNLTGYSGDLTNRATFGQPTGRATQVFGSGGPRAFQLAVRLVF